MATTTRMAKTQPLMSTPPAMVQHAAVSTAPREPAFADTSEGIPMSFCWGLLGISAVTFAIQLWTYLS